MRGLGLGDHCIATIHRAENPDDPPQLPAGAPGLGRLGRPVMLLAPPRGGT